MNIYEQMENMLPEMKELRQEYEDYLKQYKITKTNTEKLQDFFVLCTKSYEYDGKDGKFHFHKPDINRYIFNYADTRHVEQCALIMAMTFRDINISDKINRFPDAVKQELRQVPDVEGCKAREHGGWFWKFFPNEKEVRKNFRSVWNPDDKTIYDEIVPSVRYTLNVKPNVGFFKKLDKLCLKNDIYEYKTPADDRAYDSRTDPIVIYGPQSTQKQMLEDLSAMVKPYLRKDRFDILGYTEYSPGVFTAKEVNKEMMLNLMEKMIDTEDVKKYRELSNYDKAQFLHDYNNKHFSDKGMVLFNRLIKRIVPHKPPFSLAEMHVHTVMAEAYRMAKQQDNQTLKTNSKTYGE